MEEVSSKLIFHKYNTNQLTMLVISSYSQGESIDKDMTASVALKEKERVPIDGLIDK